MPNTTTISTSSSNSANGGKGKDMRTYFVAPLAAIMFCSLAYASVSKTWDGTYSSYKGKYLIYSNDLDEKQPPTQNDRRVSFMIEGPPAKEVFDSIGPDLKIACGASSGVRVRQKGDMDCTYDRDDRVSPYTCHFGFNLRTGKSILGSTC
jgi:hypothetical protein